MIAPWWTLLLITGALLILKAKASVRDPGFDRRILFVLALFGTWTGGIVSFNLWPESFSSASINLWIYMILALPAFALLLWQKPEPVLVESLPVFSAELMQRLRPAMDDLPQKQPVPTGILDYVEPKTTIIEPALSLGELIDAGFRYEMKGDKSKAAALFEKALDRSEGQLQLQLALQLASIYRGLGQRKDALLKLNLALAVAQNLGKTLERRSITAAIEELWKDNFQEKEDL